MYAFLEERIKSLGTVISCIQIIFLKCKGKLPKIMENFYKL